MERFASSKNPICYKQLREEASKTRWCGCRLFMCKLCFTIIFLDNVFQQTRGTGTILRSSGGLMMKLLRMRVVVLDCVPAIIRPSFLSGKGPSQVVALSGDFPNDIYKPTGKLRKLSGVHKINMFHKRELNMARRKNLSLQGLPFSYCWLGAWRVGDIAGCQAFKRTLRSGELKGLRYYCVGIHLILVCWSASPK